MSVEKKGQISCLRVTLEIICNSYNIYLGFVYNRHVELWQRRPCMCNALCIAYKYFWKAMGTMMLEVSLAKILYQCDCTTNTQIRCIHKYSENDMLKTIGGICVIVGYWVGRCRWVGVYIGILVYIMPTIWGIWKLLGVFGPFGPRVGRLYVSECLHWYCIYRANNWGVVCKLFFTLVLYILCQQLGG